MTPCPEPCPSCPPASKKGPCPKCGLLPGPREWARRRKILKHSKVKPHVVVEVDLERGLAYFFTKKEEDVRGTYVYTIINDRLGPTVDVSTEGQIIGVEDIGRDFDAVVKTWVDAIEQAQIQLDAKRKKQLDAKRKKPRPGRG